MDGTLSHSVARYLQLSQAGTHDALLHIDVDGLANFAAPEQTVLLSNAWAAGNLARLSGQSDVDNLLTLIENRVLLV